MAANGFSSSGSLEEQKRLQMNSMLEQRKALLQAQNGQPVASTSALPTFATPTLSRSAVSSSFNFLPGGLPVKTAFTKVQPLRKTDKLPEITTEEHGKIKQWTARDNDYDELLQHDRRQAKKAVEAYSVDMVRRTDWMGNTPSLHAGASWSHHTQGGFFALRTPTERNRLLAAGKRKTRVETVAPLKKTTPRALASFSEEEEWLIPIRLEFDHETQKIRDVFTWNMRDAHISPEIFVRSLCEDLQLPANPFYRELLQQLNAQLEEAKRAAYRENVFPHRTEDEMHEDEIHDEIDEDFWRHWRKRIKLDNPNAARTKDQKALDSDAKAHEELRIVIKLDITFFKMQLLDQFEWNIADPHNSPEQFARTYAADLGLPGDFVSAISHSIREQIDAYAKSLGLIEHQPGNPVIHEDLRFSFLPPLSEPVRVDTSITNFTPQINYFSDEQLLHVEREREREVRRKRRQTRGRQVVTLPDREPVKTHRTLMPAPGATMRPARVDEENDEVVPPSLAVAEAYPIVQRRLDEPKPVALLREEDSPPAKPKPVKEKDRTKILGKRKMIKEHSVERATSLDLLNGAPSPSGSSEWQPKAESREGTPISAIDTSMQLLPESAALPKIKIKARTKQAKKSGFGSPPSAQDIATQHDNYINGVWHCGNCGGPEGIVPGRRQGPRGKDTLCGECGKFYHRQRKNRPCIYNTSAEHHLALQRQKAAEAEQAAAVKAEPRDTYVPDRTDESEESEDEPIRRSARPPVPSRRHEDTSISPTMARSIPPMAETPSSQQLGRVSSGGSTNSHIAAVRQLPPAWMMEAAQVLRQGKPDDRFDIIPRPRPASEQNVALEWRIRCADCPGKLYTPGPAETLDNFSVHLKNRQHRANVDARLGRPSQEA